MNVTFTANVDTSAIAEQVAELLDTSEIAQLAAQEVSTYDIACEIDLNSLAYEIDTDDVARGIDLSDLVDYLSYSGLADEIDMDELAVKVADNIPADTDLEDRVQALETQVQSLLGLLDYVFNNARKGITLVDAGTPLDLSDSFVQAEITEIPAQAQPVWEITEIPNYL